MDLEEYKNRRDEYLTSKTIVAKSPFTSLERRLRVPSLFGTAKLEEIIEAIDDKRPLLENSKEEFIGAIRDSMIEVVDLLTVDDNIPAKELCDDDLFHFFLAGVNALPKLRQKKRPEEKEE